MKARFALWGIMDKKKKIVIGFFLFMFSPIIMINLINCIAGYIPPTESYKKSPYQFEALFNEKMAQYGMSIDIDSVNFSYGDGLSKTVPIQCEDGSILSCTYHPTSERKKALIQHITYTQELTGVDGETIYIEQLLTFMLDEFDTAITKNKDVSLNSYHGVSYNEAIRLCKEFIDGEEDEAKFFIFPKQEYGAVTTLERKADEKTTLSVSMLLWSN